MWLLVALNVCLYVLMSNTVSSTRLRTNALKKLKELTKYFYIFENYSLKFCIDSNRKPTVM